MKRIRQLTALFLVVLLVGASSRPVPAGRTASSRGNPVRTKTQHHPRLQLAGISVLFLRGRVYGRHHERRDLFPPRQSGGRAEHLHADRSLRGARVHEPDQKALCRGGPRVRSDVQSLHSGYLPRMCPKAVSITSIHCPISILTVRFAGASEYHRGGLQHLLKKSH